MIRLINRAQSHFLFTGLFTLLVFASVPVFTAPVFAQDGGGEPVIEEEDDVVIPDTPTEEPEVVVDEEDDIEELVLEEEPVLTPEEI